jgi:hypothetical protein
VTTIRLWDIATGAETARIETDAPIQCLTALSGTPPWPATRLVDRTGWRSWISRTMAAYDFVRQARRCGRRPSGIDGADAGEGEHHDVVEAFLLFLV